MRLGERGVQLEGLSGVLRSLWEDLLQPRVRPVTAPRQRLPHRLGIAPDRPEVEHYWEPAGAPPPWLVVGLTGRLACEPEYLETNSATSWCVCFFTLAT